MALLSLLFRKRVGVINLLFYLIFNLILSKISIQCTNPEISLNETFQVFENISIEINYPEIFDDDEEFVVVKYNASLKNDTFYGDFEYDSDDLSTETIVVRKIVRKCCGNNEIYAEKVCRVKENVGELLGKFQYEFNRTLMTSEKNFYLCEADEVVVEYDSIRFEEVTFNGEFLKMKGLDAVTNFCIDFNSDQDKKSTKLTVRACMSKSICESVPCIRKCCKGGEKYQYGNDTSMTPCVPFKGNVVPAFYNIQHWHTKDQVLEKVKNRGMIYYFRCEMSKV